MIQSVSQILIVMPLTNAEPLFIPDGFLPFGSAVGDSNITNIDRGSSEEIQLNVDVVMFGSPRNRLYVSL